MHQSPYTCRAGRPERARERGSVYKPVGTDDEGGGKKNENSKKLVKDEKESNGGLGGWG